MTRFLSTVLIVALLPNGVQKPFDSLRTARIEKLQQMRNDLKLADSSDTIPTTQKTELLAVIDMLEKATTTPTVTQPAKELVSQSQRDGMFIVTIEEPDGTLAAAATKESFERATGLARDVLAQCNLDGESAQIIQPNGYVNEGAAAAIGSIKSMPADVGKPALKARPKRPLRKH